MNEFFNILLYALPPLIAFLLALTSAREVYFRKPLASRARAVAASLPYFAATYLAVLLACSLLYGFIPHAAMASAAPEIIKFTILAGCVMAVMLLPNFAAKRAAAPRNYSATIACWLLAGCWVVSL